SPAHLAVAAPGASRPNPVDTPDGGTRTDGGARTDRCRACLSTRVGTVVSRKIAGSLEGLRGGHGSRVEVSEEMSMSQPLRVAVVGAGPAGIYAADNLCKSDPDVTVDIFDRLPTPYGLI